jgi:hypothetical protein
MWRAYVKLITDFRVRVTLRLAIYHQSVRLGANPLRLTTSNFIFQLNLCGHSPYVTSSLTRGWSVIYNCCWSSPTQSFSGPSPAGLMTTFYCLRFETPPTWRPRSPNYTPRKRVARLYPQALGSLFVASYDSQDCGGGIRPRLHMGSIRLSKSKSKSSKLLYDWRLTANQFVVAYVFVAAGTCLPSCCLETAAVYRVTA